MHVRTHAEWLNDPPTNLPGVILGQIRGGFFDAQSRWNGQCMFKNIAFF
jgi:hypothetical protein